MSQQPVHGHEAGGLRILAPKLPVVADSLTLSLDELFRWQAKAARAIGSKRGPVPQW